MIAAVSLRMLYLIFHQVLGLVLLLGRSASSKDVELLVLRRAGTHERHEVRAVDRTPAILGGLDQLERHGQTGRTRAGTRISASARHPGISDSSPSAGRCGSLVGRWCAGRGLVAWA